MYDIEITQQGENMINLVISGDKANITLALQTQLGLKNPIFAEFEQDVIDLICQLDDKSASLFAKKIRLDTKIERFYCFFHGIKSWSWENRLSIYKKDSRAYPMLRSYNTILVKYPLSDTSDLPTNIDYPTFVVHGVSNFSEYRNAMLKLMQSSFKQFPCASQEENLYIEAPFNEDLEEDSILNLKNKGELILNLRGCAGVQNGKALGELLLWKETQTDSRVEVNISYTPLSQNSEALRELARQCPTSVRGDYKRLCVKIGEGSVHRVKTKELNELSEIISFRK